jgi:phage/plasmid primase-like uncharacterized protein
VTANAMRAVYQALYALATDDKAELCYLHQTLLDGDRKADIDSAKRQKSLQEDSYLDHARSVAIRMFPVSTTIGIAEGIETALSCYQIYGVNTWAVINSGFMKKFRPGRCEASDYFCRHGQALCNWTCRGVRVRPRKPAGEKRPGESQHTLAG